MAFILNNIFNKMQFLFEKNICFILIKSSVFQYHLKDGAVEEF